MNRRKTLWMLVAVFLLISCTSSPSPNVAQGSASPTSVVTATPTPTIMPTPPIGPVPKNCPVSDPVFHTISPNLGQVIGTSPVWATWARGRKIMHLVPTANSSQPSDYLPPYGWPFTKVIWEVGPDYHQLVTLRGYEISNHTPLLFQFLSGTPTADAVLDPQHPDHPVSVVGSNWAEWGSTLIVSKAGCYVMNVFWPTGHWSLTFAIGA
jgi:hypothetical protein